MWSLAKSLKDWRTWGENISVESVIHYSDYPWVSTKLGAIQSLRPRLPLIRWQKLVCTR